MADWVVMSRNGGTYTEAWRGTATSWFSALESVPVSSRSGEMVVVQLDDLHIARLIDADEVLAGAQLVRTLDDGSLKRVRAADDPDG